MSLKNLFWRNADLPYIEVRKTTESSEPYKAHIHDSYLSICVVESGRTVMTHQGGERISFPKGWLLSLTRGGRFTAVSL